VTNLAKNQVEFDLGSEDIIARHGSVERDAFRVGTRRYSTVVLPEQIENLNGSTLSLLESYAQAGGRLFYVGNPPLNRVDGQESDRGLELLKQPAAAQVDATYFVQQMGASQRDGFSLVIAEPSQPATVYHMRRRLRDGDLLFIVNTRIDAAAMGSISSRARSVQKWDLETGAIGPYAHHQETGGIALEFELPPCGSLLLFLSEKEGPGADAPSSTDRTVPAAGPLEIRAVAPNVLTLDYLDLTINGNTHPNLFMYEAARRAFQSVGLQENPWDHAVQFTDELISKKLPPNSGFTATYHFTIEGPAPGALVAVVERPDLYTITCNGAAVTPIAGEWWLDRAFGKVDLSAAVRSGENTLTLVAPAMTMFHEIAAVYLLGDFGLNPVGKGCVIVPARPLELGPWNGQGRPFYAAGVCYEQRLQVGKKQSKYRVKLTDWYGSVAKVLVNGELAGHIGWQPAECDVTSLIREGENRVEVIVIGSLKNTLGPHHGSPPLGIASPHSFRKAPESGPPPGSEYNTVRYGLMTPFELIESQGPG
jgi:hypothetical protein